MFATDRADRAEADTICGQVAPRGVELVRAKSGSITETRVSVSPCSELRRVAMSRRESATTCAPMYVPPGLNSTRESPRMYGWYGLMISISSTVCTPCPGQRAERHLPDDPHLLPLEPHVGALEDPARIRRKDVGVVRLAPQRPDPCERDDRDRADDDQHDRRDAAGELAPRGRTVRHGCLRSVAQRGIAMRAWMNHWQGTGRSGWPRGGRMLLCGVQRDLSSLARAPFDVLVIGGGIVGACTARDAARRGLRVALVERDDFCGGISWNSLKIVHGGLRSLQSLDVAQARSFVRERRAWLTIAPHLVHPLPFVVPTRGAASESALVMRAGLALNEIVSRERNEGVSPSRRIPRGRALGSGELERLAPGAFPTHRAGVLFHDAQLYSAERLVMAVLDDAVRAGAVIANYAEAMSPVLERDALAGVAVEDRSSGERFDVRAGMIVNAAGAGAAAVASRLTRRATAVTPMTGLALNLVLAGDAPPAAFAVMSREGGRHRRLFVVPWRGRTLVGTAHYACASAPAIARRARAVRRAIRARGRRGVAGAFAHARMRCCSCTRACSRLLELPRRCTARRRISSSTMRAQGAPQLLTAIGPKLTTSRAVAEQLVDLVCARLGRPARPCETATAPLASAPADEYASPRRARWPPIAPGCPTTWSRTSCAATAPGRRAIDMVRERPALADRIEAESPVIAAQLAYGARAEMAMRAGGSRVPAHGARMPQHARHATRNCEWRPRLSCARSRPADAGRAAGSSGGARR